MQISTYGALAALVLTASPLAAQQTPPTLPTSAQVLPAAVARRDQGDYAAAIAQYLTVPASDTSYARVQSELGLSYLSNKQYPEALAAARRAIDLGYHSAQPYIIAASAEEELGRPAAALQLYADGLRRFPYNQPLWYAQGVTQDKAGDTKSALGSLQRSAELGPQHASTHFYLGYLALRQGQTAHALISLMTSLVLQPEGERSRARLIVAEQLASNTVTLEAKEKLPATFPNQAFQELDELLNSKIALRKDYVSKVKFDANVVKQAQLLVEKFPAADADPNDLWLRLYAPLVQVLRRDDNLTPFTYLLLSSADDRSAAQWVKGNKGRIEKMGGAAADAVREIRLQQLVQRDGKPVKTKAWYNDDGQLVGLGDGEQQGTTTTLHGPWLLIDEVGALHSEGLLSETGKHAGTWRFYHANGQLAKQVSYDDAGEYHGAFTEYHDNGMLSIEATYVHGKTEGVAKLHSYCGTLSELRPYKGGDANGEAIFYYPDGKELGRTVFKADKRDGRDVNFYPDGTLETEYVYADDLKHGSFAVYYPDKVLEKKGAYDQGELHGPYVGYFPDGKEYQTGTYDHGKTTGPWREYYRSGKLSTEINYNAAGQMHGKYLDYDSEGVLSSEFTYDQGRVTQLIYFDRTGKVISKAEVKKGKTPVRVPQLNGQPRYTGQYLNGQPQGEWRWFYRDGTLQTVRHYANGGQLTGALEEYFANGRLKSRQQYAADQADGYYEAHYLDGPLRQTGFYQRGQQQGQWKEYYVDGRVSEEFFYRDGNAEGPARSFTPTGKLTGERQYANDRLLRVVALDSTGKELNRLTIGPETKEMALHYPNGKVRYRMPMLCYDEHGTGGWLTPAGTPDATFGMRQGRRDGPYKVTGPAGKTTTQGQYRRGKREGAWKTYFVSGALHSQGVYRDGSEDGEWTTYFENGKPELIIQYQDGTMDGTFRQYNPLGELLVEKRYAQGRLTGFRGAGPDGQPGGPVQEFATGSGPLKTQFANGKPALDETYQGATWEGARTYYYSTGQVYRRAQNKDGVLTGKLETFYPDGKLMEEEYYLHDELHGRSRYYRPDGTLERDETYRSGERYGPTVYYNAQGKPLKTEVYWNTYVYDTK